MDDEQQTPADEAASVVVDRTTVIYDTPPLPASLVPEPVIPSIQRLRNPDDYVSQMNARVKANGPAVLSTRILQARSELEAAMRLSELIHTLSSASSGDNTGAQLKAKLEQLELAIQFKLDHCERLKGRLIMIGVYYSRLTAMQMTSELVGFATVYYDEDGYYLGACDVNVHRFPTASYEETLLKARNAVKCRCAVHNSQILKGQASVSSNCYLEVFDALPSDRRYLLDPHANVAECRQQLLEAQEQTHVVVTNTDNSLAECSLLLASKSVSPRPHHHQQQQLMPTFSLKRNRSSSTASRSSTPPDIAAAAAAQAVAAIAESRSTTTITTSTLVPRAPTSASPRQERETRQRANSVSEPRLRPRMTIGSSRRNSNLVSPLVITSAAPTDDE